MAHFEFSFDPEKNPSNVSRQGYVDSLKQIGVDIDNPALYSEKALIESDPYKPTKLDKIAMKEIGTGYQPPPHRQELERRVEAYRAGKTYSEYWKTRNDWMKTTMTSTPPWETRNHKLMDKALYLPVGDDLTGVNSSKYSKSLEDIQREAGSRAAGAPNYDEILKKKEVIKAESRARLGIDNPKPSVWGQAKSIGSKILKHPITRFGGRVLGGTAAMVASELDYSNKDNYFMPEYKYNEQSGQVEKIENKNKQSIWE